jgi:hypothetical protein
MTDLEKFKYNFRQSRAWRNFRKVKFTESSKDFVTHKKLKANYSLHHLDLNPDHYTDISDPTKFENLNKESHGWVHELYRYYRKDPEILDRLKELLDRMVDLNSR